MALGDFIFLILLDYSKEDPRLGLLGNNVIEYSRIEKESGLRSSRPRNVFFP